MADLVIDVYDPRGKPPQHVIAAAVSIDVTEIDGTDRSIVDKKGIATKTFDVPVLPGTQITLRVQIGRPTPKGGKSSKASLLHIMQFWIVDSGGMLTPIWSNDADSTPLHLRIQPATASTAQLARFSIDLAYIDVTDVIRTQSEHLATYDRPHATFDLDEGEFEPKDMHHGCSLHVYERTAGDPRAWCAVVPPAVREAGDDEVSFLVYYRPSYPGYKSAVDTEFAGNRLNRQTRDPPKWGPFFARKHGSPFRNKEEYEFDYESYEDGPEEAPRSWYAFSFTGFEGQLAASRRKVVLLLPLPTATEFTAASQADLRETLASLARAMHADGTLPRESRYSRTLLYPRITPATIPGVPVPPPVPPRIPHGTSLDDLSARHETAMLASPRARAATTVGRIALAGYSAGGDGMLQAFLKNVEDIDEMYWFDPSFIAEQHGPFTDKARKTLVKWLNDNTTRRIAIIGGSFHKVLSDVVTKLQLDVLGSMEQIFFTPPTTAIFAVPGGIYHQSMTPPGMPLEMLDLAETTAVTPLSRRTGFFVKREGTDSVDLSNQSGTSTAKHGFTAVEASGALAFLHPAKPEDSSADPVASSDYTSLAWLTKSKFFATIGLRHQWVVSGGRGAKARYPYGEVPDDYDEATQPDPGVFEGYLGYCLKKSGFGRLA